MYYKVPKHENLPSTIIPSLEERASASSIACVVMTTALSCPSLRIPFHISLREAGSTPADASSMKTIYGLPIIAMARVSFLLLPPLSAPALVWTNMLRPNLIIMVITDLVTREGSIPVKCA